MQLARCGRGDCPPDAARREGRAQVGQRRRGLLRAWVAFQGKIGRHRPCALHGYGAPEPPSSSRTSALRPRPARGARRTRAGRRGAGGGDHGHDRDGERDHVPRRAGDRVRFRARARARIPTRRPRCGDGAHPLRGDDRLPGRLGALRRPRPLELAGAAADRLRRGGRRWLADRGPPLRPEARRRRRAHDCRGRFRVEHVPRCRHDAHDRHGAARSGSPIAECSCGPYASVSVSRHTCCRACGSSPT